MNYNSIDIFSGAGGLSTGLYKAGFKVAAAIEIDLIAVQTYKMNYKKTLVISKDVRKVTVAEIKRSLNNEPLHLLAGCPPCQGFSTVRNLNGRNVIDKRNNLILQYLRLVKGLRPYTIMLENVPGLQKYYLFKRMISQLVKLGYKVNYEIVNVQDYGVPQRRKRLVLVGSRLAEIKVAEGNQEKVTVRQAIGKLEPTSRTKDPIHKIFPKHSQQVMEMIKLTPKDGGSRTDLPIEYRLACHKNEDIGFRDVYGRLKWDDCSSTITGGCLKPSKGRFLHPTKNRTITAREAALLQSFPKKYKFPTNINKDLLALLIGNALPPKFSYIQSLNIKQHLDKNLKRGSQFFY